MPRHEAIETNLLAIFSKYSKFFEEMAEAQQMDGYKNAFISLAEKGHDIKHYEQCFESLSQACREAVIYFDSDLNKKNVAESPTPETYIGGESELRKELNKRIHPKTIARPTLYNYLEDLQIRKSIYTTDDLEKLIQHLRSMKSSRKS